MPTGFEKVGLEAMFLTSDFTAGVNKYNQGVDKVKTANKQAVASNKEASTAVQQHTQSIGGLVKGLGAMLVATGAIVAFRKAWQFAKQTIGELNTLADSVYKLSKITGATATESSQLVEMADDMKISFASLSGTLRIAMKKGLDVTIGGLGKLSDAYRELETPGEKGLFLLKNFGKAGIDLTRIMEMGSAGITKYMAGIGKGQILDEKALENVRHYQIALDGLSDAWASTKLQLAKAIVPKLDMILTNFTISNEAEAKGRAAVAAMIRSGAQDAQIQASRNTITAAGTPTPTTTGAGVPIGLANQMAAAYRQTQLTTQAVYGYNTAIVQGTAYQSVYAEVTNATFRALWAEERAHRAAANAINEERHYTGQLSEKMADLKEAADGDGESTFDLNGAMASLDAQLKLTNLSIGEQTRLLNEAKIATGAETQEEQTARLQVEMVTRARALGVITLDEYTKYMNAAKNGTQILNEAEKASIQAALDHADAVKKDADAALNLANNTNQAAVAQMTLSQSLVGATKIQYAKAAWDSLNQQLKDNPELSEQILPAMQNLATQMGLDTPKSIALAGSFDKINEYILAGRQPLTNIGGVYDAVFKQISQFGTLDLDKLEALFYPPAAPIAVGKDLSGKGAYEQMALNMNSSKNVIIGAADEVITKSAIVVTSVEGMGTSIDNLSASSISAKVYLDSIFNLPSGKTFDFVLNIVRGEGSVLGGGSSGSGIVVGGSKTSSAIVIKKAFGGNIHPGQGYTVGDHGQEFLFPKSNGYVMDNADSSRLLSAMNSLANSFATRPAAAAMGAPSVNIYVNRDVDVSKVKAAVTSVLRKEM